MLKHNLLWFSMCSLPTVLSLDMIEKSLPPLNKIFIHTDIEFPSQVFPSPSWKVSAFSASSCIKDAPLSSLWPFVVLTAVCVCLLLSSPELGTVLQLCSHQCSGDRKDQLLNVLLTLSTSSATTTLTPLHQRRNFFPAIFKTGLDMLWVSISAPNKHRPFLPCFVTAPLHLVDGSSVRGCRDASSSLGSQVSDMLG